jgi:predicted PurR-regulated permease PerM
MLLDNKPYTFDRVVRIGIGLIIAYVIIRLVGYLSDVLIPFAIGALIAYLLNPLVVYVQKVLKNRILSVIATLVGVLLIIVLIGWIFIPRLLNEIMHMGQLVTSLVNNSEFASQVSGRIPHKIWDFINQIISKAEVQDFFKNDKLLDILSKVGEKILPGIWSIITGATSVVIGIAATTIVFVYILFLLIDYDKYSKGWKKLLPYNLQQPISEFVVDFIDIMNKYFRGQALIAFIIGILTAIGFSIIGLPMAIFLGLFVGILNMVPYLQIVGVVPTAFMAVLHSVETGQNVWVVLGLVTLIFLIIQAIQDYILTPKIMGKVTGLNPAIIVLSITIWGKLLGFLGLIIALPMTYLFLTYYRRFLSDYEKNSNHQIDPNTLNDKRSDLEIH